MSVVEEIATRLGDIYDCLKAAKIQVYLQGQHKGECNNPYVVVKPGIVAPYLQLSTNVCYYELLLYIPKEYPTQVESFKDTVKKAMLDLYPMMVFADAESSPYFDDSVEAWMVDLTYKNYRKRDSVIYQKLKS